MKIISRYLWNNIMGRKGRTLLIVFCLMICSITAMLTLDMSRAIGDIMRQFMGELGPNTDFLITSDESEDLSFLRSEEFPENESLKMLLYADMFYSRVEDEYAIVKDEDVAILGFDTKTGSDFGMPADDLLENEVILNEDFAQNLGFQEGDSINIHDVNRNLVTYKIKKIVSVDFNMMGDNVIIMSEEGMARIDSRNVGVIVLLNILDDKECALVKKIFDEKYKHITYTYLFDDELFEAETKQTTQIFLEILVVCVLMVIFVTISISNRIICERMSVIGTMRSIGFTSRRTTIILLAENLLYGFLGGLFGVMLYCLGRNPIIHFVLNNSDELNNLNIQLPVIRWDYGVLVIFIAMCIECACSLKGVINSVNVSIRDIIFSTRDTKYELKRSNLICGLVLAVISLICGLVKNHFIFQTIAFMFLVFSLALLLPYIVNLLGKRIQMLFEKRGKIVRALATTQCFTKKNTVGAIILIGTVSALCISVFMIGDGLARDVKGEIGFTSDIHLTVFGGNTFRFKYIEKLPNVTDVNYIYSYMDKLKVDEKEVDAQVYRFDESVNSISKFGELPDTLADDEMIITERVAKQIDKQTGDTMVITYLSEYFLPVDKEMKIVGISDNHDADLCMIGKELFDRLYPEESVSYIDVYTSTPEETIETIRKYSMPYMNGPGFTQEEAIADQRRETQSILTVIYGIMILGMLVTFVGSAGNLLLGFESRKREIAVLLATSMTKKQVAKMLIWESFIASGLAIWTGVIVSAIMLIFIKNMITIIGSTVLVYWNVSNILAIVIGMWIVFTMVAIVPIKALYKMKISEQLKYE